MVCCCVALRIGAMVIGTLGVIASVGKVASIYLALVSRLYKHLIAVYRTRFFNVTSDSLQNVGGQIFELVLNIINILCGSLLVYVVRYDIVCPISATCIHSLITLSIFFGIDSLGNCLGINLSVDTTHYEFLVFLFGIYLIYGGYCGQQELMKEIRLLR
ncbi:unnamed protein product [Orchesella dallaii]|uniref:Uncharacterized protein n=1 Tax=Orchesella dallaii TaxID=48710 RepID=A0ABP1RGI0_9HEXA